MQVILSVLYPPWQLNKNFVKKVNVVSHENDFKLVFQSLKSPAVSRVAWAWRVWGGWEDFIEWGHMVFKRMGGGISRRQHSTNGSYKKTDCQLNSNEDGIISKILLRRKQNPPLLLPPPQKKTRLQYTKIKQNKPRDT